MNDEEADFRAPSSESDPELFGDLTFALPAWVTRHRAERVLWAVPILVVVALGYAKRWTFDDGFIYFRTVDQIMAGNGPVFNAGARVETFTSPLWMAMLTTGDLLSPVRLEYTAAFLSISSTAAGLVLGTLGSARLVAAEDSASLRLPLGVVVLAVLPPVWMWSTGGLEVGATFAWLGACTYILARWATRSSVGAADETIPRYWLVVLGLGWLVRPELAVSSVLFVALVVLLTTEDRRRRWRMIAIAIALPLAYELFRMAYYGMLVSSPAVTKEGSKLRAGYGWDYLTNFVGSYLLAIPLLAIAFAIGPSLVRRLMACRATRAAAVVVVITGSGCVHAASIVLIGGDYVHARLLMPALFAFLAPFFVVAASRNNLEAIVAVAAWSVLAALVLRTSSPVVIGIPAFSDGTLTYEERGYDHRGIDQEWLDGPGLYVLDAWNTIPVATEVPLTNPDRIAVAAYGIGAIGYVLGPDAYVIDMLGLADPITAHQRLEFRSFPGHEKFATTPWVISLFSADPTMFQPDQFTATNPWTPDPTPLSVLASVAWAQAALTCDSIDRLRDSYDESLTPGVALDNLWHAAANTTMRIDANPRAAYAEYCGDDIPTAVESFYDRADVVEHLPSTSHSGQIAVMGDCAATFVGTGETDQPWTPLEAETLNASVTFSPADTEVHIAAVFVEGPYGEDYATVWVETDGLGHYRVRQDLNWFPPVLQPWSEIPGDAAITIAMVPDLDGELWTTTVNNVPLTSLGIFPADQPSGAVVPVAAGPSSTAGTIDVEHEPPSPPSPTCQAILDRGG